MPFFLGLIPSKFTYEYLITVKEVEGKNTISEQQGALYIVETWGSVNTIKKIFGVSNDLESLESKLFAHLERNLIMPDDKSLHVVIPKENH